MQHISQTTSIVVNATPDETLPLFTAVGETLWIAGWNPTYVYPESGEPSTGMIWTTANHDQTDSVWVTVNYDTTTQTASYIKWTPNKHVTRVDIQCQLAPNNKTSVQVTYTLTALNEHGYEDIRKMSNKAEFDGWIKSWENEINHYLEHGTILQAE